MLLFIRRRKIQVLFISSFPPRRCGVARFTEELADHLDHHARFAKASVIALAEPGTTGLYCGGRVVMALDQGHLAESLQAASDYISGSSADVVHVQHEFSFFGSDDQLLTELLSETGKPVVVTFHTVHGNPPIAWRKRVEYLCPACRAATVPSRVAKSLLASRYNVDERKIWRIPLGIPDVEAAPPDRYKSLLGMDGQNVLSTFGFLSRNKGIELVIRALPAVVGSHPNTVYVVIGETHPAVRAHEQERYREELAQQVREFGLEEHVLFINRYVPEGELLRYIMASDIYVAPYRDRGQVSSYTLSYAMGCGKAVVSSPTMFAQEVLAGNRGVLSDFDNPDALAGAISGLLDDRDVLVTLSRNAFTLGRTFHWRSVIQRYAGVYERSVG